MKTFKFVLIALALSASCQAEIGTDKLLHFGVSAGLTAGFYLTLTAFTGRDPEVRGQCLVASAIFATGFGLAKEIMDSGTPGNRFDGEDMVANLLGVGVTAGLLYLFDARNVTPHPKGIAWRF